MAFVKVVLVIFAVLGVLGTLAGVIDRSVNSVGAEVALVLSVGFLGVIRTLEHNAEQSVKLTQAAVTDLAARVDALRK